MFAIAKIQYELQFISFCLFEHITGELQEICEEYHERIYYCESSKFDLEYDVRKKDWEVLPHFSQNPINEKNLMKRINKNNLNVTCYMLFLLPTVAILFCFVVFFFLFLGVVLSLQSLQNVC